MTPRHVPEERYPQLHRCGNLRARCAVLFRHGQNAQLLRGYNSWHFSSRSASFVWNRNVHYRIYKIISLEPSRIPSESPKRPFFWYEFRFELLAFLSQAVSTLQVFKIKFCMHMSSFPCVLHYPFPFHIQSPYNVRWEGHNSHALAFQFHVSPFSLLESVQHSRCSV